MVHWNDHVPVAPVYQSKLLSQDDMKECIDHEFHMQFHNFRTQTKLCPALYVRVALLVSVTSQSLAQPTEYNPRRNIDVVPLASDVEVPPDTPHKTLSGDDEEDHDTERVIASIVNEFLRKVAHIRLEEVSHILHIKE